MLRLNMDRHKMRAELTGNVRFTKNRLLQIVPIILKNPVMALGYRVAGVRPYSGTYTNPGAFVVPAGDGAPYPADGGHPGPGHDSQSTLCFYQLWGCYGDHLCRHPAGD